MDALTEPPTYSTTPGPKLAGSAYAPGHPDESLTFSISTPLTDRLTGCVFSMAGRGPRLGRGGRIRRHAPAANPQFSNPFHIDSPSERALGREELLFVLDRHWKRLGRTINPDDFTDAQAIAAIERVTRGNFRLLERLFPQVHRVLKINQLETITVDIVEAAASILVIGT